MMSDHSTKSISSDELEELLENFELNWSSDRSYLEKVASPSFVEHNTECLVELIRCDIDMRYRKGLEAELRSYCELFPALERDPRHLRLLGFEEYRVRSTRGLHVSKDRWQWIPGIAREPWFQNGSFSTRECSTSQTPSQSSIASNSGFRGVPKCDIRIGGTFDNFRLVALLGRGAFSEVYLATQPDLADRYVAVKLVKRTLNEPGNLARLQHTGIIPLYSVHRVLEYTGLCMPYFGAATLADWFHKESLESNRNGQSLIGTVQDAELKLTTRIEDSDSNPDAKDGERLTNSVRLWKESYTHPLKKLQALTAGDFAIWFAQRLSAALAHAHERGIVHGDLKPANVLLKNDGEPALIDFNLSRDQTVSQESWVGGTLPYMAPEQLQSLLGRKVHTSPESDIYSLGIILYELVEGKLPFESPTSCAENDLVHAIELRKQPLIFRNPSTPLGLVAIIRKCLSTRPADRYLNGSMLLEDVECQRGNLPLVHATESWWTSRFPKLCKRYPRLFSVGPVAMLSILIAGILAFATIRQAARVDSLQAIESVRKWRLDVSQSLPDLVSGEAKRKKAENRIRKLFEPMFSKTQTTPDSFVRWMRRLPEAEQQIFLQDTRESLVLAACLLREASSSSKDQSEETALEWLRWSEELTSLAKDSIDREGANAGTSVKSAVVSLCEAVASAKNADPNLVLRSLATLEPRPIHASIYWLTLGDTFQRAGQTESAIFSFGKLINDTPARSMGFSRRAAVYGAIQDWKSAERDLSDWIREEPTDPMAYAERARIREKLQKHEDAIEDLNRAIELAPNSNRFFLLRSRLHRTNKNIPQARADYERGLSIEPACVDDWVSRGLAKLPRDPRGALSDLEVAETIEPTRFAVLQNLAHIHSEYLHDFDRAILFLERLIENHPEQEASRADYCVMLARVGRTEDALNAIAAFDSIPNKTAPTLYQLGCAYALLSKTRPENKAKALNYLWRAITQGYGAELIASDQDLDALRDDPVFSAMKSMVSFVTRGSANAKPE